MHLLWKKKLVPFSGRSVLARYFVTYAAILLIPCLILGLFFFNRATTQINQDALETQQYKTDQLSISLSKEFDNLLAIVSRISIGDGTSDNMIFQPYRWQNDQYSRTEVIWELNKLKEYSSLVGECILIYRQYNVLFTSSLEDDIKGFFTDKFMMDNGQEIESIMENTNGCTLLSASITDKTKMTEYQALLYIVPFNLEKIKTRDMAMVFVIPEKALDKWSRLILGTKQYRMNLMNNDKSFMFSYGSSSDGSSLPDFVITEAMLQDGQAKIDGQTFSFFESYAQTPKLTTILETPWDSTLARVIDFRNLSLIIGSLTVLLGLILVILFSYSNYAPLKKIMHSIKEFFPANPLSAGRNEYEQLDGVIRTAIVRNKNLEDHINRQSKMFFTEILSELLAGTIHYERLDKTFDVSSALPGPYYSVIAIHSQTDGPGIDNSDAYDLSAIGDESSQYAVVDMPAYHCTAIIISLGEDDETLLHQKVHSIRKRVEENHPPAMGVSRIHRSISSLNHCMVESFLSLNCKGPSNTGIRFYRESIGRNFRLDLAPQSQLFDFTQCLKNGNESECMTLLGVMLDSIEKNRNPISAQMQYYQIANAVLWAIRDLQIGETPVELNFLELFQDIDSFRQNMGRILREVFEYERKHRDDHKQEPLDSILLYINDHYLDYNLTLERLSSDYGLSVSMISKLFKDRMGVGFKEYLINKRLDAARHMLCTTSMPIHEIVTAVGYTNESHFIKKFKHSKGMTPAQYRQKYGAV